jgi:magnesium chelatase subunit I
VGYEDSAVPALERAILAGHDIIMLGERGQAKSRLIRHLMELLDDAVPVIQGCELNDHPYHPICARCRALVSEDGDATPVTWIGRTQRFSEKLATPDTSVADLIGDVDPIRVAEGRYLSDELTIHYGLVPRTHRGIFAINELPDLPERIQVALLNILEERDVQIRGYKILLPLDLVLIASANPEDYTHRGRIITPLKDRFGTQVRTHYPRRIDDEIAIMDQEARPAPADVNVSIPRYIKEVLAELAAALRASPQVNQRSGVSVRFTIGALEALAASALRRAVRSGEDEAVPRAVDLWAVMPGASGRIEFDTLEEGREPEIMGRALKEALHRVWSRHLGREDFSMLLGRFAEGLVVQTSDLLGSRDLLAQLDLPGSGLQRIADRLRMTADSPAAAASALEFALEGLHLDRRLNKDEGDGPAEWRFEAALP